MGAAAALWFAKKAIGIKVAGVGDVPVWNKGHIKNWFAYEHYGYPEKIMVDLNPGWYVNDGCVEVESHGAAWAGREVRNFSIRKKDLGFLREMCERYNVEYIEI